MEGTRRRPRDTASDDAVAIDDARLEATDANVTDVVTCQFESPQVNLAELLTGIWRHLIVDLNFKTQTVSYATTDTHLDGTVTDGGVFSTSMSAPQDANARWISVGLRPNYAPDGTTIWQSRYDNVWCNLTP